MDFQTNEELIEFLNIDIKEKGAIDKIFKIIIDYLSSLNKSKFEYSLLNPFTGIMNKFTNCAKYLGAATSNLQLSIDKFLNFVNNNSKLSTYNTSAYPFAVFLGLKYSRKRFVIFDEKENITRENIYYDLYNQVVLVYNSIKDFSKETVEIELNGFFNPNLSNKVYALNLIREAIDIINKDDILSEKSKISIIEYLNKAVYEFEKPNSNWSIIFGKLKQTVFVLGALGSLAGGISGAVSLNDAKHKLEEATEVIEKSSINVNYENVNQLFNIVTPIYIENIQPKLLIEKNINNDKAKESNIIKE